MMKFAVNNKMKTSILAVMTLAFLILSGQTGQAQNKYSLILAYGRPAGFLDYNVNGFFSAKLFSSYGLTSILMMQETFSTKRDLPIYYFGDPFMEPKTNAHMYYNDFTVYALAQKQTRLPHTGIFPFVSAGWGLHTIYSWTGKYEYFRSQHKLTFTGKLHGFAGIEIKNDSAFYAFISGRATYPSDIIFDSIYFGIGLFP